MRRAVFALVLAMAQAVAAAPVVPMIDAHAHYVAADAAALAPDALIATLDAAGVSHIVVTGTPAALAQRLHRAAPARVIPLLGVYDADVGKADWMRDANLTERVASELRESNWAGIGELHLFAPDARAPVFVDLVKLADAHGLVLLLHGDAAVISAAFEVAPNVRILWAHLGTDPNPATLDALLARHPDTLWIDTSVRDARIAPAGRLLPEWRTLFERHSERFVVAVDTFSLNRWRHYGEVVDEIRAWTAELPAPLRRNLLHDNAARLFDRFLARAARR